MQHIWELYIILKDEEVPLRFFHVTQSSRKAKAANQVLKYLKDKRGIKSNQIDKFYLEMKR